MLVLQQKQGQRVMTNHGLTITTSVVDATGLLVQLKFDLADGKRAMKWLATGQRVVAAGVTVTFVDLTAWGKVRLGFDAAAEIKILREELLPFREGDLKPQAA